MPLLDIVDSTFIVAPASELRTILCDETRWHALGMPVSCYDDRGVRGKRWKLERTLTGTAEVWLEEAYGGVIVHCFVQADPVGRQSGAALRRGLARPLKRWVLDVKRAYDVDRPAGLPSPHATSMETHGEPDEEG